MHIMPVQYIVTWNSRVTMETLMLEDNNMQSDENNLVIGA